MKFHDFSTGSHLYLRAQAKFCITIKFKVIFLPKIYKHMKYRGSVSQQSYTVHETKDYPPPRSENKITTLIIMRSHPKKRSLRVV